ncbi:MAG: methyltransferase domain-containing protein [Polyangiaceae bacterium]|nr:methyltransferase domain-containing protein [Polyangiaceae bacterium]
MKQQLLSSLVCVRCQSALELRNAVRLGREIARGELVCRACGQSYPVRDGIPRFVPNGAYAASFGREWHWFRGVQIDARNGADDSERQLAATTGYGDADYAGRRMLDAGVGAGRFAEVAARKGAEVVGVDLTEAVDAAAQNLRGYDRVDLVQADIFALPFRPESFDTVYSIGVLHHTPDPARAFRCVAERCRPGGDVAIYVYARNGIADKAPDLIRKVTTKLPPRVMLAVASYAVFAYPLYRAPLLGKALRLVAPISEEPRWRWRWLDTFDGYTPTYQWKHTYPEVLGWFRAAGVGDLVADEQPIRIHGRRQAEAGAPGQVALAPAGRAA